MCRPGVRREHLLHPLGIDAPASRFSWQSDSTERNWSQSAYEVLVASKPELLADGAADAWDRGRAATERSVGIVYTGPQLKPTTRYFWTIKVWDSNGNSSAYAATWWEAGVHSQSSWEAKWICRIQIDRRVKGTEYAAINRRSSGTVSSVP